MSATFTISIICKVTLKLDFGLNIGLVDIVIDITDMLHLVGPLYMSLHSCSWLVPKQTSFTHAAHNLIVRTLKTSWI